MHREFKVFIIYLDFFFTSRLINKKKKKNKKLKPKPINYHHHHRNRNQIKSQIINQKSIEETNK